MNDTSDHARVHARRTSLYLAHTRHQAYGSRGVQSALTPQRREGTCSSSPMSDSVVGVRLLIDAVKFGKAQTMRGRRGSHTSIAFFVAPDEALESEMMARLQAL